MTRIFDQHRIPSRYMTRRNEVKCRFHKPVVFCWILTLTHPSVQKTSKCFSRYLKNVWVSLSKLQQISQVTLDDRIQWNNFDSNVYWPLFYETIGNNNRWRWSVCLVWWIKQQWLESWNEIIRARNKLTNLHSEPIRSELLFTNSKPIGFGGSIRQFDSVLSSLQTC